MGRVLGHLPEPLVHSGHAQRSGGCPVTSEPSSRLRMDPVPGSGGQVSEVLVGEHRSVHHLPQFSVATPSCLETNQSFARHEVSFRSGAAILLCHEGPPLG